MACCQRSNGGVMLFTQSFTTVSRANREVSTGHPSTFLIFKCSIRVNTSQVVIQQSGGRKIPKDNTCCCNSRSFFFSVKHTHCWWAWNDEQSTSTLELHPSLHNTFEGTSALAISLPRNAEMDLTRGTDDYEKRKYWKTRRDCAIWSNNLSTCSDRFPSPTFRSDDSAGLECAATSSISFINLSYLHLFTTITHECF